MDTKQRLQRNLEKQTQALQGTLLEISHLEKVAPNAAQLLMQLRTKRDRQQNALKATQQYIDILNKKPATK